MQALFSAVFSFFLFFLFITYLSSITHQTTLFYFSHCCTFICFSDSFTCTPTFICHLFLHTTYSNLFTHNVLLSLLPVLHLFPPSEESDYHTDYEEEALESALSDMELYNRYGEHTEGEETADTVRTTGYKGGHYGDSSTISLLLGTVTFSEI